MRVDLVFSPQALASGALAGRTALVIDVLRASTTIVTVLANGARAIVPCFSPEEARERAQSFSSGEALLGGERGAQRLPGFALGNSPLEYTGERVRGRTILFTTTNGTGALLLGREAAALGTAGFVNVSAAVQWVLAAGRDLTMICSGEMGGFCLEDTVCGGMVVTRLQASGVPLTLSDAALAASLLSRHYEGRVRQALEDSEWGRLLKLVQFERDLEASSQVDAFAVVPVLAGDEIVVLAGPPARILGGSCLQGRETSNPS